LAWWARPPTLNQPGTGRLTASCGPASTVPPWRIA
jgi:hypothetical protein